MSLVDILMGRARQKNDALSTDIDKLIVALDRTANIIRAGTEMNAAVMLYTATRLGGSLSMEQSLQMAHDLMSRALHYDQGVGK